MAIVFIKMNARVLTLFLLINVRFMGEGTGVEATHTVTPTLPTTTD